MTNSGSNWMMSRHFIYHSLVVIIICLSATWERCSHWNFAHVLFCLIKIRILLNFLRVLILFQNAGSQFAGFQMSVLINDKPELHL